jgi:alpha-glucosidase
MPAGLWYDFWTGHPVQGDDAPSLDPALDSLPLYVRAGAIIPSQPIVQSTAQKPQGPLQLTVYPGPDCHGSLYLDDGSSFAYRHGNFYRAEFTCRQDSGELRISGQIVTNAFPPWWSEVKYVIMGLPQSPHTVSVAGAPTKFNYDAATESISVQLPASAIAQEIVVR